MSERCATVFERLMFYLLFTTGLRVGGLVAVKVALVAHHDGSEWHVRPLGTTVEKGGKSRTFPLNGTVRALISEWLGYVPSDVSRSPTTSSRDNTATRISTQRVCGRCSAASPSTRTFPKCAHIRTPHVILSGS
jgi:integrase